MKILKIQDYFSNIPMINLEKGRRNHKFILKVLVIEQTGGMTAEESIESTIERIKKEKRNWEQLNGPNNQVVITGDLHIDYLGFNDISYKMKDLV